jgi:hypothetical protein
MYVLICFKRLPQLNTHRLLPKAVHTRFRIVGGKLGEERKEDRNYEMDAINIENTEINSNR